MALQFYLVACSLLTIVSAINFYETTDVIWGFDDGHAQILDGGELLTLSLDKKSGSAFTSMHEFRFGRIDIDIKLVKGNSAGTVTTFYLTSQGPDHDEIDFEFLGNLSGDPYTLHTNVFAKGVGGREMQFHLWFDPTENFHTYSIIWNPKHIIIMVDGTPIRDFVNMESRGIPFPNSQPMAVYCSIWDAEDWATQGGLIKTDWSQAPFTAAYRNFTTDACIPAYSPTNCSYDSSYTNDWWNQELDSTSQQMMLWAQQNYMTYNYCTDYKRFPDGLPPECSIN